MKYFYNRFEQLRESSGSLKAINTSELCISIHNFMVVMKYRTIMLNDCCLFAINRNTLKSFLSQFCKEKQSEILCSYFYQKLTLNTKKSNICRSDFHCIYFSVSRYIELRYQFAECLKYNMCSMYYQGIRSNWLKYFNIYQHERISNLDFNPLQLDAPFPYPLPLKTSENQWF